MKKLIGILILLVSTTFTFAQKKVYFTEPGELILQFTQTDIEGNTAKNGIRASYFTNWPCYMNINFGNHFGLMPGISLKNIGIKTKDEQIDTITYKTIKRRIFAAGASFAAKFGSFYDKGFWCYAGAGIDWAFHYRQKLYETSKKVTKEGEWLSKATPSFIPSVFLGIQTPISLNIKATYYPNDFLSKDYNGPLGDFGSIAKSQLFTLSFSIILKEKFSANSSNDPELTPPSRKEKTIEL